MRRIAEWLYTRIVAALLWFLGLLGVDDSRGRLAIRALSYRTLAVIGIVVVLLIAVAYLLLCGPREPVDPTKTPAPSPIVTPTYPPSPNGRIIEQVIGEP